MPNGPDSAFAAGSLRISFDLSPAGAVGRLAAQGVPAWWAASHADAAAADLLGLPAESALAAAIAGMHGSAAPATGVEAICPPGIGARLVRYRVRCGAAKSGTAVRVELVADAGLADLESLLAKLHKASHDLRTTTATVLASAQLLADAAPASPAAARNRDRIERAIRAALAADAENLNEARRKLAAVGAALARAT